MSRAVARSAAVITALLLLVFIAAPSVPGQDTTLAAKAAKADKPTPTPTAPPDLVASYRAVCERMPAVERERCLLGIVEQLGLLMDEKSQLDICKALSDPLSQAICTALATGDPSQCGGLQGETAALDRELCVGSVAETTCFRLPRGAERDQCLLGIATGQQASLACASIAEYDVRWLCQAVALRDESLCARIADPDRAEACRKRVKAAATGAATATASPGPSGQAAAQAGQSWSGSFSDIDGSSLSFVLGADGRLTVSGAAPGLPSSVDIPFTLEGVSDASGSQQWKGEVKVKPEGGGEVQMDALAALPFPERLSWTAQLSGDHLVGEIDGNAFDLAPKP